MSVNVTPGQRLGWSAVEWSPIRCFIRLASLRLELAEDSIENALVLFLALKDGKCKHRGRKHWSTDNQCFSWTIHTFVDEEPANDSECDKEQYCESANHGGSVQFLVVPFEPGW
jgi:hypothetical protein